MSYPPVRFTGDTGEVSATAREGTAGPDLVLPTTNVHHLATGATTGGDFGLYFGGLAELAASGRDGPAEEMTEFLRSHDQYMVGGDAG